MKVRIEWTCPKCGSVAVEVGMSDIFRVKCPVCGNPMEEKREKNYCDAICNSSDCKDCENET